MELDDNVEEGAAPLTDETLGGHSAKTSNRRRANRMVAAPHPPPAPHSRGCRLAATAAATAP